MIPKNLKGALKEIGIPVRVRTFRKSALLGKERSLASKVSGRNQTKSTNIVVSRTNSTCANKK